LNGNAAQDIADGDIEVVVERGACRDRDLGQVGGDREEDEPAEGLPEPRARRQYIRGVGERRTRYPDGDGGNGEDSEQKGQR